jgi:peptidylprolyl isomerase
MITASPGDKVTVHYTLTFRDGTILATTRNIDPVTFTLGKNTFFKGFENAIEGMAINQLIKKTIKAIDAFGEKDESLIIDYPRDKIPAHIMLEIGKKIEITQEDGTVARVAVEKIEDATVTLNGNPELAGHDLQLSVELINVDEN